MLSGPEDRNRLLRGKLFRLAQLEQFAGIAIVSQEWRWTRAERWRMISATWRTLKDVVLSFIDDEALTRGAAIAFYTATSIAPVLLIVIAIAGLVFGQEAAQNAINFAI